MPTQHLKIKNNIYTLKNTALPHPITVHLSIHNCSKFWTQNTRIEQLNKDFHEILSLKTAYDHQSEKLSANIEKMKILIKNSSV